MTYIPMAERRLNGSKVFFDRMGLWLAEYDDLGEAEAEKTGGMLLEEAMDLFYDLYKDCSDGESPWAIECRS